MERKKKQIDIFDHKAFLYERTYAQVSAYLEESVDLDNLKGVDAALRVSNLGIAIVLRSLEPNKKPLPEKPPLWAFWLRKAYKERLAQVNSFNRMFTPEYLATNLTQAQILHYANEVLILEGFKTSQNGEHKKKVVRKSRKPSPGAS